MYVRKMQRLLGVLNIFKWSKKSIHVLGVHVHGTCEHSCSCGLFSHVFDWLIGFTPIQQLDCMSNLMTVRASYFLQPYCDCQQQSATSHLLSCIPLLRWTWYVATLDIIVPSSITTAATVLCPRICGFSPSCSNQVMTLSHLNVFGKQRLRQTGLVLLVFYGQKWEKS